MKIGITYDLRDDYIKEGFGEEETAEFDRKDTIDAIENSLNELGYETERIGNIKSLIKKLANNNKWDLVFNICEGMYGIGRESQVPAILDAYKIPYTFSDPLVLSLTLHKAMTKKILKYHNLSTPDFFLIENENEIDNINLPYPLFIKPNSEGTGKGITKDSKINNYQELKKNVPVLLKKFNQPVLVETFLPGREFTAGIVGTGNKSKVIGIIEIKLTEKAEKDVYSYINKEFCEELVIYDLLKDDILIKKCSDLALQSWKILGCRDAGRIDIRLDKDNNPNFIEVNPLAGLNPVHSDLPIICSKVGISYKELINNIINSAIERIKL